MICKLCGREVSDDALYCDGCGNSFEPVEPEQTLPEPLLTELDPAEETAEELPPEETAEPRPPKIHSHMAMAVLTTVIFFNWILGIPAIVFARECERAAEAGQYDIAMRFSKRAITFALIGVALNIAIASFITLVAVVLSEAGPAIYPYLNY